MKTVDVEFWLGVVLRAWDHRDAVPALRGRPEIADRLIAHYATAPQGLRCTTLNLLLSVDAPQALPLLRSEAAHLSTRQGHSSWCPTREAHPDGVTRYLAVLEPHLDALQMCTLIEELDHHRCLSLETLLWLSARRSQAVCRHARMHLSYRYREHEHDEVKRLVRAGASILGEWLFEGHRPSHPELVAAVLALSGSTLVTLRKLALHHATRVASRELLALAAAMLRRETDDALRKELVSLVCERASALDLDPLLAVTELGDEAARRLIVEKLPVDREPAAYRRAQDLLFCDPSPAVRLAAVKELIAARELPYVGVPMRLTLSQDPVFRFWGMRWLQRHPEPEARARLVKLALTDPVRGVRASAAKRVAAWDPGADREALLAMTRDEDARVRRRAVQALLSRPGPEARERFREMIQNEGDRTIRALLIHHFQRSSDPADLAAVERALSLARAWPAGRYGRERTVNLLEVARWRIVHVGVVIALDPASLLRHPRGDVRRRAALDLVRAERPPGGPRAADLIEAAMRDDGRPRLLLEDAAAALCELSDERDLPQLVEALMRTSERPLRGGDARRVMSFVAAGGLPCLKLILRGVERIGARYTDHAQLAFDRAAQCVAMMRDPRVDLELTALASGPSGRPRALAERALAYVRKGWREKA